MKKNREIINRCVKAVNNLLRSIPFYNEYENTLLSAELYETVREIKEKNSKTVFDCYYLPKATEEILAKENYLATPASAKMKATAMMFDDLAQGKLNEFYRFEN